MKKCDHCCSYHRCISAGWLASCGSGGDTKRAKLNRIILPIPYPNDQPIKELDARKAKTPPVFEVKAPKEAPNVVMEGRN